MDEINTILHSGFFHLFQMSALKSQKHCQNRSPPSQLSLQLPQLNPLLLSRCAQSFFCFFGFNDGEGLNFKVLVKLALQQTCTTNYFRPQHNYDLVIKKKS